MSGSLGEERGGEKHSWKESVLEKVRAAAAAASKTKSFSSGPQYYSS